MVYADDTWTVAGEPSLLFGESTWDPTVIANDMTDTDGDGIFTWEKTNVVVSTNTSIAFKVVKNHHWNSQENPSEAYPADNYTHTLYAATYDITITFNSSTHDVQFSAIRHITSVKLAGSFNSWSESEGNITLSKVGDTNVYTCDVDTWTDDVEFKLIANNDWLGYNNVPSITAPDGWVVQSDETNKNFKLKHNSLPTNYKSYTITATWTPNEYSNQGWAIEIEGKEAKINTVKLSGSFNGWKGADADCIILSKVGDTNVYTCDVAWTEETQFQLIANDLWMKYTDVGEANIDAPDGWVVKSDETYKNFLLKGRSFTHYLSYTITATWTPNKYANQGWAISIVGKEAQPYTTNTVTYVDGNGWEKVYAYIYPNTDYVAWHGTDITSTKSTTTIGGNSYNVYTFNYNVYEGGTAPTNIIFNDGGSTQSPDYELVAGKQYRYGLPAGKYVLAGNNTNIFPSGWTAESSTQELTDNGDGTYSYSIVDKALTAGTSFEFKVVDIANSALVWYPAENVTYTVNDAATYDFDISFNPSTSAVAIVGKRQVAIDAAGFTSFSSGHYLDWSTVENAAPYMATLTGETGNKKALLSKVTATNAGQGALIKGTPNTIAKPVIASVENTFVGNLFVATNGAISASTDGSYNYVYSAAPKPGFYKLVNEDLDAAKVKANGAYLHTTVPLAADPATSRVSWIFDDEVTGINQIENTQPATVKNTVVYNLNGQRVMNPAKGLYIVNGKKVIIK